MRYLVIDRDSNPLALFENKGDANRYAFEVSGTVKEDDESLVEEGVINESSSPIVLTETY